MLGTMHWLLLTRTHAHTRARTYTHTQTHTCKHTHPSPCSITVTHAEEGVRQVMSKHAHAHGVVELRTARTPLTPHVCVCVRVCVKRRLLPCVQQTMSGLTVQGAAVLRGNVVDAGAWWMLVHEWRGPCGRRVLLCVWCCKGFCETVCGCGSAAR